MILAVFCNDAAAFMKGNEAILCIPSISSVAFGDEIAIDVMIWCLLSNGRVLIERIGYRIIANKIDDSKCPHCGVKIAGYEL